MQPATMPAAPESTAPSLDAPTPSRRADRLWLGALAAYWVLLFAATHFPQPEAIAGPVLDNDKAIHASAYFVLTTLMLGALRRPGGLLAGSSRLVIAAIAIAYGAFDETTQPYFNRVGDLADWFADSIGVALAVGFDCWRSRSKQTRLSSSASARGSRPS